MNKILKSILIALATWISKSRQWAHTQDSDLPAHMLEPRSRHPFYRK